MKAEVLQNNLSLEQQKNYNLQVQLDQLKAAAEENNRLQLALNARFNATELPDNVAAVVEYFSQMFADKLVFTKDAVKSIKSCTLSSKELWKVFFALANTMRDLYMVGTGDIYATFNQKTGIVVKRGEGAATRNDKKLMKQFKTELNGDTIDIETHITYPKLKQSIHFGYSEKLEKLVVGHCGAHLDNYSTRKIK